MMIDARDAALYEAPKAFDSVGVDVTHDVDLGRVHDAAVVVAEAHVLALKLVLDNIVTDSTDRATHYYASYIPKPKWAEDPAVLTRIYGVHKFFRNVA